MEVQDCPVIICLERGQTGLGFNIKGGTDMQIFPGDSSIYVAKIKQDGAAALDGRLQKGDKIISVNGFNLEKVKHQEAVNQFISAGAAVEMTIISGEEKRVESVRKQKKSIGNWLTTTPLIAGGVVVALAVATSAVYLLMRYRKQL